MRNRQRSRLAIPRYLRPLYRGKGFFVDVMFLSEVTSTSCALVHLVNARLVLKRYSPSAIIPRAVSGLRVLVTRLGTRGQNARVAAAWRCCMREPGHTRPRPSVRPLPSHGEAQGPWSGRLVTQPLGWGYILGKHTPHRYAVRQAQNCYN